MNKNNIEFRVTEWSNLSELKLLFDKYPSMKKWSIDIESADDVPNDYIGDREDDVYNFIYLGEEGKQKNVQT